jgi:hypothetical protein
MLGEIPDSCRSNEKICSNKIVEIVIFPISVHLMKTALNLTKLPSCVAHRRHALWNLGFITEAFHESAG